MLTALRVLNFFSVIRWCLVIFAGGKKRDSANQLNPASF